jgi:hypothetical protein
MLITEMERWRMRRAVEEQIKFSAHDFSRLPLTRRVGAAGQRRSERLVS